MPPRAHDATEDHPGPSRPSVPRGREVLLCAFPRTAVLPVPVAGDRVGRDWLERQGLADGRVSGQHLAFSRAGGALFVEDLDSRNGTFVEGVRLRAREKVRIDDGARIRLGRTVLVYREAFLGSGTPSEPLGRKGALVGPFGLREVSEALEALRARPQRNILLEGETGTGKELLARVVAETLGRDEPYAALNIAGVPEGVFESQLFGYVPGAYSGSGKGAKGVLLEHDRGTVFLDEIGELPLSLQPKLLRFLENREVFAVGASRAAISNVIVVAATLCSLEELVASGGFREDLLSRFPVRLELPPLRERSEDLFAIMQAVAKGRGERYDPAQVEVESVERLMLYPWHRNVRELASVLERVAVRAPPPALPFAEVERVLGPLQHEAGAQPLTQDTVERALQSCEGNESAAARKLGITRARLRRFLKKA